MQPYRLIHATDTKNWDTRRSIRPVTKDALRRLWLYWSQYVLNEILAWASWVGVGEARRQDGQTDCQLHRNLDSICCCQQSTASNWLHCKVVKKFGIQC